MRRVLPILLLLGTATAQTPVAPPAAAPAPATATQPPAPIERAQPTPRPLAGISDLPTLRTSAHEVVLDVVVTDAKGNPVPNLKASDFTLMEDRRPQTIRAFEEHTPSPAPVRKAASLPPNTWDNAPADMSDVARTVLLFDAAETPIADQMYARQQILRYIKQQTNTAPFAAFMLDTELHLLHDFNDDPATLDEKAFGKKLQPEVSIFTPGNAARGYITAQFRRDALNAALQSLARYLAAFPGRKNLIWITSDAAVSYYSPFNSGSLGDLATFTDQFVDQTDVLNLGRIAIYPVNARGLTARGGINQLTRNQYLDDFARSTGGRAYYNTNGITEAMTQIVDAGARYYTLTYSPSNTRWDGEFRRIQVALADRNLKLSYRNGYVGRDVYHAPAKGTQSQAYTLPTVTAAPSQDHRPLPPPPPDSLQASMGLGAVAPFQIAFRATIEAANAALDKKAVGTTQNFLKGEWQKKPARAYTIHYHALPNGITLVPQADGRFAANIQFVAVLYDDKGDIVNSNESTADFTVSAEQAKQIQHSALAYDQQLLIPNKGTFYLRLGVHDVPSDHIGALEIPTETIKLP